VVLGTFRPTFVRLSRSLTQRPLPPSPCLGTVRSEIVFRPNYACAFDDFHTVRDRKMQGFASKTSTAASVAREFLLGGLSLL
jgi:hypothetical protein